MVGMVKKIIGIIILGSCVFSGCKSNPRHTEIVSPVSKSNENESGETDFWNTGSASGELIFHGVAGIYSKKEESIRLALEDAAKKVAIFNMVEGTLVSSINVGAGFLDYISETKTSLTYDENYKDYVEALLFDPEKDVVKHNNAVFVRVRYKASLPDTIQYRTSSFQGTGKPAWIDNPPSIPGYAVGVGYAGRRAAHHDTVIVSYENAIFSIITSIYGSATEEAAYVQGSGVFDVSSTNRHKISAAGILNNFYILDTWLDPANKSVWTLAMAKKTVN